MPNKLCLSSYGCFLHKTATTHGSWLGQGYITIVMPLTQKVHSGKQECLILMQNIILILWFTTFCYLALLWPQLPLGPAPVLPITQTNPCLWGVLQLPLWLLEASIIPNWITVAIYCVYISGILLELSYITRHLYIRFSILESKSAEKCLQWLIYLISTSKLLRFNKHKPSYFYILISCLLLNQGSIVSLEHKMTICQGVFQLLNFWVA